DPIVRTNIRQLIPVQANTSKPVDVKLVYRCNHFAACYALNRFLVLLLAQFLKDEYQMSTLMPHRSIANVTAGHTHTCGDPDVCEGVLHDVTLLDYHDCRTTPSIV